MAESPVQHYVTGREACISDTINVVIEAINGETSLRAHRPSLNLLFTSQWLIRIWRLNVVLR